MEVTSSMVSQFPRTHHRAEYKVSTSRLDKNGNLETGGNYDYEDLPETSYPLSSLKSLFYKIAGPPDIRPLQGISLASLISSLVILSITLLLVVYDKVDLSFRYTKQDVNDYESKVKFMFRWMILPSIWLVHTIMAVTLKRFRTIAWDPMGGHDDLLEVDQRILQNTLEQTLLSFLCQLILLDFLSPLETLKVIPFINIWFFLGRILFWALYPRYRTFGFCFSMVPNALSLKVVLCRIFGIEDWVRDKFFS